MQNTFSRVINCKLALCLAWYLRKGDHIKWVVEKTKREYKVTVSVMKWIHFSSLLARVENLARFYTICHRITKTLLNFLGFRQKYICSLWKIPAVSTGRGLGSDHKCCQDLTCFHNSMMRESNNIDVACRVLTALLGVSEKERFHQRNDSMKAVFSARVYTTITPILTTCCMKTVAITMRLLSIFQKSLDFGPKFP